MTDYNEMLNEFKKKAESLSDRELLEGIYAMLHFLTYLNNEHEKMKLDNQMPKASTFPDMSFCQTINPMPFDKIKD